MHVRQVAPCFTSRPSSHTNSTTRGRPRSWSLPLVVLCRWAWNSPRGEHRGWCCTVEGCGSFGTRIQEDGRSCASERSIEECACSWMNEPWNTNQNMQVRSKPSAWPFCCTQTQWLANPCALQCWRITKVHQDSMNANDSERKTRALRRMPTLLWRPRMYPLPPI